MKDSISQEKVNPDLDMSIPPVSVFLQYYGFY